MLDGFDPEGNPQDRKILHEVIGTKLDRDIMKSSTSDDSDSDKSVTYPKSNPLSPKLAILSHTGSRDESDDGNELTVALNP